MIEGFEFSGTVYVILVLVLLLIVAQVADRGRQSWKT